MAFFGNKSECTEAEVCHTGTVNILGLQLQLTVEPDLGQLKVRICTG